jgi:small conductance mechanosensitive channel
MFDLDALLQTATTVIASWAPKVAGAVAVLVIGWIFAGWVKSVARRALLASRVDQMLVPFLSAVIHTVLVVLISVTAVGVIGVSTASFVAVLGATGLAIALAFQGTFSHFASGVMLLTFRPFEVGHVVEVGGVLGTVKEVGIFFCLLATPDNVHVRVPNSQIFDFMIKNYTASGTRRVDLVVGVSYDDDLGTAIRTCQDVIASDARVLEEPETVVAVDQLADSSVNLVVRPWVTTDDYWATRWDLTRALKQSLEAAGCSIPYPQRDVHMRTVVG